MHGTSSSIQSTVPGTRATVEVCHYLVDTRLGESASTPAKSVSLKKQLGN